MLIILPVTASRAAWCAITAAIIYMVFNKYKVRKYFLFHLNTPVKKYAAVAGLALVLAIVCAGTFYLKKKSATGRLFIWQITCRIIKNNPLTGIGFDRFKTNYMNYQAAYFTSHPNDAAIETADDVQFAFNEPLQFIAENGWPVTIISGLFLIGVYRVKSKEEGLLIIAKAGLLATLVFGLFSYPSQILAIKINCVLYLAIIASIAQKNKQVVLNNRANILFKLAAGLGLFISVAIFFKVSNGINKVYHAFKNWDIAYSIYQAGSYKPSLDHYELAYPHLKTNGEFLMQYGKALLMAAEPQRALPVLNQATPYFSSSIIEVAKGDGYKAIGNYKRLHLW